MENYKTDEEIKFYRYSETWPIEDLFSRKDEEREKNMDESPKWEDHVVLVLALKWWRKEASRE